MHSGNDDRFDSDKHRRILILSEGMSVWRLRHSITRGLVVIVTFAIGPLIGLGSTKFAIHRFESTYGDFLSSFKRQNPGPIFGIKDLTKIPELSSLDHFCAVAEGHEVIQENLCGPYHDMVTAQISAGIALELTPLLPVMLFCAGLLLKRPPKKRGLFARAMLWLILKSANTIIALKCVPVCLGLGFSIYILVRLSMVASFAALICFGFIYSMETAVTEWYTKEKITVEVEVEPPKPSIKPTNGI